MSKHNCRKYEKKQTDNPNTRVIARRALSTIALISRAQCAEIALISRATRSLNNNQEMNKSLPRSLRRKIEVILRVQETRLLRAG